jgi:hypothetical protein
MKNFFFPLAALLYLSPLVASSQSKLFEDDQILQIQITGTIRSVLDDRGDKPSNHPMVLSYKGADSIEQKIPVQIKTRGHFRKDKGNCFYPPLLISFPGKDTISSTIFSEQKKLKLVMPCKDDDYVIREWLVYKIYNLVTPKSFRARLVKVQLNDPQKKKQAAPFIGFILEEEKQMATRNQETLFVKKLLRPQQTDMNMFLTMCVFEYMIGNTDWSVEYLQNIKLLVTNTASVPVTVPYDFDHAGIVDANYALPAEELNLASIRVRRYRGYCILDMSRFDQAISQFNSLKNNIYALYNNNPLLDPKYIKSTLGWLDDFYKTINDPKLLKREFGYPCDPNGTGNVIIKGLAND